MGRQCFSVLLQTHQTSATFLFIYYYFCKWFFSYSYRWFHIPCIQYLLYNRSRFYTIRTTYNITSACRFRGDYNCRERPIRELLDTLIGSTVNLLASTSSTAADFIVKQIGLGISTCKITTVNFLLNLEMYNKR